MQLLLCFVLFGPSVARTTDLDIGNDSVGNNGSHHTIRDSLILAVFRLGSGPSVEGSPLTQSNESRNTTGTQLSNGYWYQPGKYYDASQYPDLRNDDNATTLGSRNPASQSWATNWGYLNWTMAYPSGAGYGKGNRQHFLSLGANAESVISRRLGSVISRRLWPVLYPNFYHPTRFMLLIALVLLALVIHMMPGGGGNGGYNPGGGGDFNYRQPPSWNPEDTRYSFRAFTTDAMLWCMLTDLQPHQQAAAIIQRLRGSARELARTITGPELLRGGLFDGQY